MYNEVKCPYCGETIEIIYDDYESVDQGEWTEKWCPYCDEEIEICYEVILDFEARERTYFTCEICGKEEREMDKFGILIKENKRLVHKEVCGSCYWKLTHKEEK